MAVAGWKFRINGGGKVNEIIDVGYPSPLKHVLTGLIPDTEYTIEKGVYDVWLNFSGWGTPQVFTTPLVSLEWREGTYIDPNFILNLDDLTLEGIVTNFQPFAPIVRLDLIDVGDSVTFEMNGADPALVIWFLADTHGKYVQCYSTGQVNGSDGGIQFLTPHIAGDQLKLKRISPTQFSYSVNGGSETTITQTFTGPVTARAETQAVDGLILENPIYEVAVPDVEPPTDPSLLVASMLDSETINCDWTASSDDVGVVAYQIQRATNVGFTTGLDTIDIGNVTTYDVNGLTPSTLYYFRVRAFDGTNYSGWSNIDSDTTDDPPPPVLWKTGTYESGSWTLGVDNSLTATANSFAAYAPEMNPKFQNVGDYMEFKFVGEDYAHIRLTDTAGHLIFTYKTSQINNQDGFLGYYVAYADNDIIRIEKTGATQFSISVNGGSAMVIAQAMTGDVTAKAESTTLIGNKVFQPATNIP